MFQRSFQTTWEEGYYQHFSMRVLVHLHAYYTTQENKNSKKSLFFLLRIITRTYYSLKYLGDLDHLCFKNFPQVLLSDGKKNLKDNTPMNVISFISTPWEQTKIVFKISRWGLRRTESAFQICNVSSARFSVGSELTPVLSALVVYIKCEMSKCSPLPVSRV